jgi:hypothetical protein
MMRAAVLPRLRQAVIVARDLEEVAGRLQDELGLGEPFSDPDVGWFGLRNAVFALRDTFLEIVSPVSEDSAGARRLAKLGGDGGYMTMVQVPELAAARERASAAGVREVFAVTYEDIDEIHLHPADVGGAILSLSAATPPASWRWGGPDWQARASDLRVAGAKLAVADPAAAERRWTQLIGAPAAELGIDFTADAAEPGLVEIALAGDPALAAREVVVGRLRVSCGV